MKWIGWAVAVFASVAVLWTALVLYRSGGDGPSPLLSDVGKLRRIVGCAFSPRGLPIKDSAFDPYEFRRRGDIPMADVFRSERSAIGPTDEEVECGDYTNFPWDRYRGDGNLDVPPFLLLWEKNPDKHGGRLVALSDGRATYLEPAEFAALLAR